MSGAYLALVVLLAVCAVSNETFRSPGNLLNILRQCSYSGIISLGMTFVIVSGGIDLSVGSLFAFCGVVTALALQALPEISPTSGFAIAAAVAAVTGAAGGTVNGLLVTAGKLPPFIATLGTLSIFRSLSLYFADSGTLMTENELIENFGGGTFLMIPAPVWIMLVIAAVLDCVLSLTRHGRYTLAVGASERVALFAGIRAARVKLLSYVITGFCAGISSFLFLGRLGSISSSNAGSQYELDAIAAVIIGGASMSGGKGTLRGTLAGVLILGIVSNILDLWGINVSLQGMVKGLVIIISVLIQRKGKTHEKNSSNSYRGMFRIVHNGDFIARRRSCGQKNRYIDSQRGSRLDGRRGVLGEQGEERT